jgi:O-6-methylguanine DNA methyltransferase
MNDIVILGTAKSPAGAFGAVFSTAGLGRLTYPTETLDSCEAWARRWAPGARVLWGGRHLDDLAAQLTAYFEGRLREFSIPLDARGTAFQIEVWRALQGVGYGEVRTYSEVAAAIGRPQAVRAVGAANGANPIPIIIPCHRLIGKNGSLIKYGGGLDMKRRLLELEGALENDEE